MRAASTLLRFALPSVLAVVTACGSDSPRASSARVDTPAGAGGAPGAAGVARAGKYCSLDPNANDPCPGLLSSKFDQDEASLTKAIEDADEALKQSDESQREVVCTVVNPGDRCPRDQYAATFVNRSIRAIDIMNYKPGAPSILIGAMRFRPNGKADRRYKVGDGLFDTQSRRKVYFVISPVAPQSDKYIVASWKLYGYQQEKTVRYLGVQGYIRNCDYDHDKDHPHPYRSDFFSCEKIQLVYEKAHEFGIDPEEARLAFECEPERELHAGGKVRLPCDMQVESKIRALISLKSAAPQDKDALNKQVKSFIAQTAVVQDSYIDTYWFSCSLGCCTASM